MRWSRTLLRSNPSIEGLVARDAGAHQRGLAVLIHIVALDGEVPFIR